MPEGKAFETASRKAAVEAGTDVATHARLVSRNGKGNKVGNRTTVDWIERREACDIVTREQVDVYVIVETKLTNRSGLTKGQKTARDHILSSPDGAMFESRSLIRKWGINPGKPIRIVDYEVRYSKIYK